MASGGRIVLEGNTLCSHLRWEGVKVYSREGLTNVAR
jgi:hypothetical protein